MKTKKLTSILVAAALLLNLGFVSNSAPQSKAASISTIGEIVVGQSSTFTHTGTGLELTGESKYLNLVSLKIDSTPGTYTINVTKPAKTGAFVIGDAGYVEDVLSMSRYDVDPEVLGDIEYYKTSATLVECAYSGSYFIKPGTTMYIGLFGAAGDSFSVSATKKGPITENPSFKTLFTSKKISKKKVNKKAQKVYVNTPIYYEIDGENYPYQPKISIKSAPKKGKKYITISNANDNKKINGSVTFKKGAPKGTYKFTVKSNDYYDMVYNTTPDKDVVHYVGITKTVTVKIA